METTTWKIGGVEIEVRDDADIVVDTDSVTISQPGRRVVLPYAEYVEADDDNAIHQ